MAEHLANDVLFPGACAGEPSPAETEEDSRMLDDIKKLSDHQAEELIAEELESLPV